MEEIIMRPSRNNPVPIRPRNLFAVSLHPSHLKTAMPGAWQRPDLVGSLDTSNRNTANGGNNNETIQKKPRADSIA